MSKFKFSLCFTLLFALFLAACPFETEGKENKIKGQEEEDIPEVHTLKILQIGASTDGNISHSFVELYNFGDTGISLSGFSLQFASGFSYNSGNGAPDGSPAKDGSWRKINLNGTIPAGHSFLILGSKGEGQANSTNPALALADLSGDLNASFVLNNRSCKAAIMKNTDLLTEPNPFNTDGKGKKAPGYVDMIGAINTAGTDFIQGFERARFAGLTKQASLRRVCEIDTDNNLADFMRVIYADEPEIVKEILRPKNLSYGRWNPFEEPETTKSLMILQVFGTTTINDSAPSHNFIELYNNTDYDIDLGTYSVHFANGASEGHPAFSPWTRINLSGTIPSQCSYLITGPPVVDYFTIQDETTTNGRLNLTGMADLTAANFSMSNRSYKVALMSNQNNITSVSPWGMPECVDLTSAINSSGFDAINAAKGAEDLAAVNAASGSSRTISKQKSWRRARLVITGKTLTDFRSVSFANLSDEETAEFGPRNLKAGAWAP